MQKIDPLKTLLARPEFSLLPPSESLAAEGQGGKNLLIDNEHLGSQEGGSAAKRTCYSNMMTTEYTCKPDMLMGVCNDTPLVRRETENRTPRKTRANKHTRYKEYSQEQQVRSKIRTDTHMCLDI